MLTGCDSQDLKQATETAQQVKDAVQQSEEGAEPTADPEQNITAPMTLRIASFNLEVFGPSKGTDEEVLDYMARIISRYDIVAVQEIRDKNMVGLPNLEDRLENLKDIGTDYDYITGPRLGSEHYKEQYAYIYRTGTVEQVDSYTLPDPEDTFFREPFIARFQATQTDFDFVLLNIHVDPDEAETEVPAMHQAIRDARDHYNDTDVIALGDFNADCDYYDENSRNTLEQRYTWTIPDHADTTVSDTDCAYDRIILTDGIMDEYTGQSGVFRFGEHFGLSQDEADEVSDHYPVWADFATQ